MLYSYRNLNSIHFRDLDFKMKKLLIPILFSSNISFACILPPQNMIPQPELGFSFKEEKSELCKNCNAISINAPVKYKNHSVSHAIFSLFLNEELIAKSVTAFRDESKAEFVAIVSKDKGFSYRVDIEYGARPCMSYQLTYTSPEND